MKSCSSYGPSVASVDCSISPAAEAGSSSGEIVVATIESKVSLHRPLGKLVLRHVADQELHQRLGDRAIRIVHAHVIGVVGRPAQRQLREVAGADDEAPGHEQEGPQPRLDVLEGQVAAAPRGEPAPGPPGRTRRPARGSRCRRARGRARGTPGAPGGRCRSSRPRSPRCSIRSRALVRVRCVVPKPGIVSPWISRRSRPSRSHVLTATSSASVESSPPETPMFSGVSGGKLLDPLGQPRALDAEDLGAAAVQLGPLRGDERRAGHVPLQARHVVGQLERDPPERAGEPAAPARSWSTTGGRTGAWRRRRPG